MNLPSGFGLGFRPRFLIGAAVPFFLGFSTIEEGSPGVVTGAVENGPGASCSEVAADEAFLARPADLIFSEMDMVVIFSRKGVASRELVEGSFLMLGFFIVVVGVLVLEDEATEPARVKISSPDDSNSKIGI